VQRAVGEVGRLVLLKCLATLVAFGISTTSFGNIVIFVVTCPSFQQQLLRNSISKALGMLVRWAWCVRPVTRRYVTLPRRLLSTQVQLDPEQLSRTTRNIGIIAHIDAVSQTKLYQWFSAYPERVKQPLLSACSTIAVIHEESEVCSFASHSSTQIKATPCSFQSRTYLQSFCWNKSPDVFLFPFNRSTQPPSIVMSFLPTRFQPFFGCFLSIKLPTNSPTNLHFSCSPCLNYI
jgi:hypothetical protein